MSESVAGGCVALIFVVAIVTAVTCACGWRDCTIYYHAQCVERGIAHYDSQTGKWQWNDEPKAEASQP